MATMDSNKLMFQMKLLTHVTTESLKYVLAVAHNNRTAQADYIYYSKFIYNIFEIYGYTATKSHFTL